MVIERQHRRHLAGVQRLSAAEIAECQQDPTKAWTIRGPKLVACIETGCGELHKQLGSHLKVRHPGLTAAEYKAKCGPDGKSPRYSKNASLTSLDLQALLSKKRKKLKLGRRLQASGKVPTVERLIASRGQRVLSEQFRIEQSRRKVGARPDLWGTHRGKALDQMATSWQIAKLRLEGLKTEVIAKRVGIKNGSTTWARLRRMGFPGRPCRFWRGEPVAGHHILELKNDFRKTLREIASNLGIQPQHLSHHAVRVRKPLSPILCDKLLTLRRSFAEASKHNSTGGRPAKLLSSDRDWLKNRRSVLLEDLSHLQQWLVTRDKRANLAQLSDRVCETAYEGKGRVLLFWPLTSFLAWIRNKYDPATFLKGDWVPFDLARQFLADEFRVGEDTLDSAVYRNASKTTA